MAKILVVEDDAVLSDILKEWLALQNHAVEHTADGQAAWELTRLYKYDLIILDVQLPGLNGVDLCKKIKENPPCPLVLMLTSKNKLQDKVQGLNAGADDYLCKPVAMSEFAARIKALVRRASTSDKKNLTYNDLTLDLDAGTARRGAKVIALAPKEFELLEILMRRPQEFLTTEALLTRLWGADGSRASLANCLKRLRAQLHVEGQPDLIQTVPGSGYCLK